MSAQHRPRRRADLSQHFLRSRNVARKLVARSSISSADLVVEIGPGRGMLTRELAARCRSLVAVEADARLADQLRAEFSESPSVEIVQADFLQVPPPTRPHKVFANIPYNRTAMIIQRLLNAQVQPTDAYLIVQLEAAERFAGMPYAPETQASLLLKPWWQIEILSRLARTDFDPPPRVDSVLLWLASRPRPLIDESQRSQYEHFIKSVFGRSGRTVRQCVRALLTGPQVRRLARDLRFGVNSPPSALTFDQWLGVFRFL